MKEKTEAQIIANITKNPDDSIADFAKMFGIQADGNYLNHIGEMIRREKGFNLNHPPRSPALSA